MQNHREERFFQRCVYYGAEIYSKELGVGQDYDRLKPVCVIAFLNYSYRHADESLWDSDNFIARYNFTENRTRELAPETINVIFVELRRFAKGREECRTERDWLFYLFKSINLFEDLRKEPEIRQFPLIRRMEDACRLAGMDKEQLTIYDSIMVTERDIISWNNAARREGRQEGREEGKEELTISLAKKMLESGVPIEQISKFLDISVEKIASLQ